MLGSLGGGRYPYCKKRRDEISNVWASMDGKWVDSRGKHDGDGDDTDLKKLEMRLVDEVWNVEWIWYSRMFLIFKDVSNRYPRASLVFKDIFNIYKAL